MHNQPNEAQQVLDSLEAAKTVFEKLNDPSAQMAVWAAIKKIADKSKVMEMDMRKVVATGMFPNATLGTNTKELADGFKLKMVNGMNYKLASDETLDAALTAIGKCGPEGNFIADRLVKFDPRLSKTEYDALSANNPDHVKIKAAIDAVLTITPASPELKIEEPKAK